MEANYCYNKTESYNNYLLNFLSKYGSFNNNIYKF